MKPCRPPSLRAQCATMLASLLLSLPLSLSFSLPAQAQFAGLPLAQGVPECLSGGLAAGQCLDLIEAKGFQQSAGKVARKEGQLTLHIQPKPLLLNNDDSEGPKYINYTYLGLDPHLKQHMLYVGFHQGDQFWAVDPVSSQISKMNGYPVFSPDRQHFATMSVDMLAGFNPNLVVVWQVVGSELKKLAEIKGDKWGPDGLNWHDAKRLEVKKVCASTDPEQPGNFAPCGAVLVGPGKAGWGLLP